MNEQHIEDSYPLSPLQQGMLFHDLYAPHSGIYIQQYVCTLHEKLNVTAFKEAWQRVIERHPVLRTSFRWEGFNEPIQRVHKPFNLRWVEEDCRVMDLREQNHRVEKYLQNDRQQGFKLTEAPLVRLALFQMSDADYRFIYTTHHAIMDGRSMFILLNEVFSFYEAFCLGKDIKLKHPRPYRDYIDWFTKEDFNKAEDYWRRMLEGVNTPTPLVVDDQSHRSSHKNEDYEIQKTRLSAKLTSKLQSLSKQHGLTPNTILQGAWALLLSRYSGEQDVVFGATRACRHSGIKGVESMVGLFIINLPVRISASPNTQLLPWLKELRSKWIAMRDYEHTPILEIQKWNDIPAGTPLYESILTFENYNLTSAMQAREGEWINRQFKTIRAFTNFPITVTGTLGSELLLEIVYSRRRFEDRNIARMLGHIETLLESIVTNQEQRLSDVRMLTDLERRQILADWNNTSCGYPSDNCQHPLFEQQVEQIPELPVQYANYAVWQRQWLQGEALEAQLNYWKDQLGGELPVLALPTDRPRPAVQTHRGAIESLALPEELTDALQAMSRRKGMTLFMTLLAAFKTLLYRHTGQEDIIVGTTIAGRNRIELEGLVGFFMNTIVMRTDLAGQPTFRELLGRVRETALGTYAHQDMPFEKLVEELAPERDLSRTPVFQVFFNHIVAMGDKAVQLPGLEAEAVGGVDRESKFDMALYVVESDSGIGLHSLYNTDLFDSWRMAQMLKQYEVLLKQIVENSDEKISHYSLLTAEAHQVLPDPRALLTEPLQTSIIEMFANWVNRTPEKPALRKGDQTLTYEKLFERSQTLAKILRLNGLERGDVVAVYGPRSFGLIVNMMAVLSSGGVLLPVDDSLPRQRQQLILQEAGAKFLLYIPGSGFEDDWWEQDSALGVQSLEVDTEGLVKADTGFDLDAVTLPEPGVDDAAYIFFTSGTTGVPKGVLGSHKGLSHFLNWQRETFDITPEDRVAHLTSLSFDPVLREIFLPLTSGATLCLPEDIDILAANDVLSWLDRERISVLHTVPSLAQSWLTNTTVEVSLNAMRWVFFAGESLTRNLVDRWQSAIPRAEIVNLYGPAETTLAKCFYRLSSGAHPGVQPLGRPLPQTQALVLSRANQLCAIGEAGEIVLRTPFRSLGYINNHAENRKRFVQNPFRDDAQDQLYYTGDRGRYRPDGTLEFLGRLDDQVKIRGVRVEPNEVTVTLARHPQVGSCFVTNKSDEQGQPRLVAYVVLTEQSKTTVSELRDYLGKQLPATMVPEAFVFLDALPLTPRGKVDRRALPAPDVVRPDLQAAFVAPRSQPEELVAGIWSNVLGLERIGIYDSFFELGGHSLLVVQIISRIREVFEVELPVRALFEAPTVAGLTERIEAAHSSDEGLQTYPLQAVSRDQDLPLSFAQQRLWFLHHLEPDSAAYSIPRRIRLKGALSKDALEKTYFELARRHETLRTTFHATDGNPVLRIAAEPDIQFETFDLRHLPAVEREAEAKRLSAEDARQPFDLERGPLLRIRLFQLADEEHVLHSNMHHIISDFWSFGVMDREIAALYTAFITDKPADLPALPVQYADYAVWQRQWLQGEALEAQLTYWKDKLGGELPVLALPTDRPRPAVQTHRGATESLALPKALTDALQALSRREGVTLFMTLLAAFKTLLYRLTGQEEIIVGTPITGRNRTEVEGLVGFFMNTIVMRTDLAGQPGFRGLLGRVRETALGAYAHQDMPFEKLVEELAPERDLSRTPLSQVFFNHIVTMGDKAAQLPGLEAETTVGLDRESKFDMTLHVLESEDGLAGNFEYNTDLFDAERIERMVGHFQTLLEGIVANPGRRLSELPILTEAERHELLVEWNNTQISYPRHSTIHQLFEVQVERTPDAIAVAFGDQHLHYRELNDRANKLANHLRKWGAGPDVCVGLCMERSVEMVVAILGILKAGGAYVPLDPEYPPERLAFIVSDIQAPVLLTQQSLMGRLPEQAKHIICLDTDWATIEQEDGTEPTAETNARNLAYIIYTSGSTGKPKGVMIPHAAICNHMLWMLKEFAFEQSECVLQKTPFTFDASVWEFYAPLISGGQLVMAKPEGHRDSTYLVKSIIDNNITTLQVVPSQLQMLLNEKRFENCLTLRRVFCGGEALTVELFNQFMARLPSVELINLYGPAEATIDTTFWRCHQDHDRPLMPIGRPIENMQVYILDPYLNPVPVGVPGELHIAGPGIGRGYLNRPDLTAEKFVSNPFPSSIPTRGGLRNGEDKMGGRLYKSGDLARYLPNGIIEFIGRSDYQVKIRGFRIELDEVECVLGRHPAVEETVVLAREDVPGDKRLVAYVVVSHEPTPTFSELRSFLKEKLLDYMIPSAFVVLDSLPLTPNDKVDRRALPMPDGVRPDLDTAYQVPRGGVEQTLSQIWKQILRIDQVGRQDNFFELGGDSILSIQIVAKANQAGLRVTPKHLFQYQTIAELAEVVEAREPVTADQGAVTGPLPLSPIQHWFFGQQLEAPDHWNMTWVLEAKQPVDSKKMEQVVEALLRHHDALRLRFVPHGTGWKQELGAPNQPTPFTLIDLSHLPYAEAAAAFSQEADRLHTTLNLSEGPLIQVAFFKFSANQADRLLLVIHHLVVDGISWRILLDDLQTAYDQLCESGSIQLPPKTTSFKEWTEGLVAYAQSNKLHEEMSYWGAVTNTPCTLFPRDFTDGINTVASTQAVSVVLGQEDTQALLQEIPEVYHTQINDVLLAALVDVLAQWSQQETICLNLEGHGREELLEEIDLSRSVGWFTSIFPVVLKQGTPGHAGELLKSVKEQLRQIPHKGIGYGLLRYLNAGGKVRDHLGDGLVPEVAFNYLGQFDQVIAVDGRWRWSEASGGANRNPQDKQPHLISINARVMNSVLQVQWRYSEAVHRRETIENLAKNYLAALVTIIRHCQSPEAGGYTPSDFPLARIRQSDLDKALTGTKSGDGKAVISDLYPLTPLQQGLWFHALANPESGVYFEQRVLRIEGYTNRNVLRQAWERVVAQHAILRTGIIWEGLEHPLQLVRSTVELPWAEVDWRESPANEHPSRLLKFLDEDRLRGFDLTQAPLMRLTLLQVAETSAILVWSFHHLILDRWSVDLVQGDVWSAYQSLIQGQLPQFNTMRPYREYIGWLQDQDLNQAEQYWRQLLNGFTAPTVLGVDQAPPTRVGHQESSYGSEEVTLPEAATSVLSRWARQQQLTLNTVVQGAWALLLSRYSGSEDVVFGTTVSGRSAGLPGIESMVGLFINTLPVRVQVSSGHGVVPWLTELQAQQVTLREYEYTPLYEIQKWSEAPAGEPLFNTLLVFENIPLESGENSMAGAAGLNVQRVPGSRGGETNYPLSVAVVPGRTMHLRFTYDTEHYTAEAITRMVGHFQQVLTGMIGDSEQTLLGAIPLLTAAERRQLLVDWNATATAYPREATLAERFEAQVEQTPDAVAVVFEEQQFTYRELNTRANQLAHYLKGFGVGSEVLVGICLERSIEMIVAVLGILKAGGAYVPLDPEYPQERLAFMLADTESPVLLTHSRLVEKLPRHEAKVICIDSDWDAIARNSGEAPVGATSVENLAYVIYTSGSTGKPKGVAISHGGLLNLVFWHRNVFEVTASDRATQLAGTAFDASVWEVWPYLTAGARLHVVSAEKLVSPERLRDWLVSEGITLTFLPTPLAEQVLKLDWPQQTALRTLLTGGDKLHRSPPVSIPFKVVNNYGPTENTVVTTSGVVLPNSDADIQPTIGCPISNTEVYVLDERLRPVPVGVPGELCIGGESLARGYLNRPNLTAENFIPNPYSDTPGARLYKSGDLVRYLQDGRIAFLGRIDHQVKIRGFRIELGEIETVLSQHPDVQEAVVVVQKDHQGEKRLVGYVVLAQEAVSPGELRQHLKQSLPEYMVPAILMKLDALPLTPNGKVDRRALPAPDAVQPDLQAAFVAPRSQSEELVAGIWSNLLGLERIGVYDSFFELGGHSLLAVRIISRIREVFEVELALRALFEAPTVAGLTKRIEAARRSDEGLQTSSLQAISRDQVLPLSFAQERFWVLDQFHTNRAVFNGSRGFRLRGPFQLEVFRESVQALVDRHEILRTTYASADGVPHQVIAPTLSVEVPLQNCSGLSKEEQAGMIQQTFLEERRFQFDLAQGPLFHARLLRFAEDDYFLVLHFHHIILDAWSLEIIIKDLVAAYTAGCKGHAVTLPALPLQYVDYAHWQRELLEGPIGREQLAFWKTQLAQLPPALPLPTDHARPAVQTFRGALEGLQLPAELLAPLRALNRQEGTTLFMVLLATLQFLLHRLTGTHDILVGSPIAGRDQQELHGLVGCFLNTLVLRTDLSGDLTGRDLLQRVREVVLNAYENQDVPFEKILAEVDPVRDLSRTPIFQVLLNMHSFDDQNLPLPELSGTRVLPPEIHSLFDMTLYLIESTDEIQLSLVYNADLFTAGRMTEFMRQLQSILEQLISDPDRPLEAFTLVTPSARLHLPDPSAPLSEPLQTSMIEMVADWAKRTPEKPALRKGDQTLTYEKLFERTQILARILRLSGLERGDVVAVYGQRSFGLIVNMMAVLSSGGVLLPIDDSLPRQRQKLILQEAGAKFLLYIRGSGFEDTWWEQDSALGVQSLEVDTKGSVRADTDFDLEAVSLPEPRSDDAAYIFFTSGTTGVPKGILGSHKGLSHFLSWQRETFDITPQDRVAHLTSLSFDPVLREIFLPLTSGATLCLPEDIDILAANDVLSWLDGERISVLHTVPSLAQSWLTNTSVEVSLNVMRWVFFAGESLTQNLVDRWQTRFPSAEIVNLYGPAETTLAKCFYPLSSGVHPGVQPLGRPLPQTQALVLSRANQLCAIGEAGEIVLRTPFRSLGYINNHAENRKRFVQNPFRDDAQDQLYYTGDRGRYRPDGVLEFLGRLDDQVKIRGVRVEPNEVTVTLARHPEVDSCFVTNKGDNQGQARLVAYVVITEQSKTTVSELRVYLRKQLPATMVPEVFVFLDALPLTPRGKVDRRALPAPDLERTRLETKFVAPRTPVEKVLAKIWSDVLGLERVGIHDNFFDLGGHSLLATRVVSRVQQEFQVDLKLMDFFKMPTIAELTKGIEGLLWINAGRPGEDEAELQDSEEGVL